MNTNNLVLYFFNDNCAPCQALRPKAEKLFSEEFPKLKLEFINAFQNPLIAAEYMVFSAPTIIVLFEGKEFRRYSKNASIAQMRDELIRPYNLLFS